MSRWAPYYQATMDGGPRDTLLKALAFWQRAPGLALDLGAGTGRDSLLLLEQGWQVIAVDGEAEALAQLLAHVSGALQPRLRVQRAAFETLNLTPCDLINASFALPFCHPKAFPALWRRVTAALPVGGLFAGQLFGARDSWATKGVTVVDAPQLDTLLADWDILDHREEEEDGHTPMGEAKHWHIHHLVLRRR